MSPLARLVAKWQERHANSIEGAKATSGVLRHGNAVRADTFAECINELEQALQSELADSAKLREALLAVTGIADTLTKDEVCDHAAGICWCSAKAAVREARALLENRP